MISISIAFGVNSKAYGDNSKGYGFNSVTVLPMSVQEGSFQNR